MRDFLREFKAFAMKGNVMDLAVAVVIGAAFGKITTSLVNNIIMPLFGAMFGGIDFTNKVILIGEAEVTYGIFIQSIIEFVIIAFAIFVFIKVFNVMQRKEEDKPAPEKTVSPSEEVVLLREIRDSLQR